MYLFRLSETEKIEDNLRKEIRKLDEKVGNANAEARVRHDKVERIKDLSLNCEYENNLIKEELENKRDNIEELKAKCVTCEEKVC